MSAVRSEGSGSAGGLAGFALAVAVAVSFATGNTLARLAYEGGTNALSMLTVRTVVALVALWVVLAAGRVRWVLPRPRALRALGLGLLLALYSYGLLGSIQYVPIAVASVTFYTYPLLVALGGAAIGRERLTPLTVAALVVAFAGLNLVVDLRGAHFAPIGIAHAFGGAVFFSALLLLSDRARGDGDSRPITLHMLATGLVCYLVACAVTGLFRLPHTALGWVGFLGCPVFFSFSFICLFVVMRRIGPVRAALVLNAEPVATALLGWLVLGQTLGALQVLGIAMVVAAIVSLRASPAVLARALHAPGFWPVASIVTGCALIAASVAASL